MSGGAIRRRLGLGAVLLTASGLLALAAPGSADAASASAARCAGRQVRTLSFATGSVHVFKGNGTVCAFTLTKRPGAVQRMTVSVQARGSRPVVRGVRSALSAGPVIVHAGHRCVRVKGSVGARSADSGWILC